MIKKTELVILLADVMKVIQEKYSVPDGANVLLDKPRGIHAGRRVIHPLNIDTKLIVSWEVEEV